MSRIVLDANIIVRYVLGDNPRLSPKAKEIIELNESYLDEVILAEVIWVLGSVYKRDRVWISTTLKQFVTLPIVISQRKYLMLSALEMFEANNLSYIDCWIYSVSRDQGLELKTQDEKLGKLLEKKV